MELAAAQIEALADSLVESHDKLMSDLIGMRKRHGLSQEAVAERMGVSQPTVAAFERYDSNPTLATLRRYALAVGASIGHAVDDQCCRADDDKAEAIVTGSAKSWVRVQPIGLAWDWDSGDMNIKSYV